MWIYLSRVNTPDDRLIHNYSMSGKLSPTVQATSIISARSKSAKVILPEAGYEKCLNMQLSFLTYQ